MAFTPEQRAEIDRLTQEAMELAPPEREAFVREHARDAAVLDEVLSLLVAVQEPDASGGSWEPGQVFILWKSVTATSRPPLW